MQLQVSDAVEQLFRDPWISVPVVVELPGSKSPSKVGCQSGPIHHIIR